MDAYHHGTKDMSFQNLVAKVEAERREQERLSEVKKKDLTAGRGRMHQKLRLVVGQCGEN